MDMVAEPSGEDGDARLESRLGALQMLCSVTDSRFRLWTSKAPWFRFPR